MDGLRTLSRRQGRWDAGLCVPAGQVRADSEWKNRMIDSVQFLTSVIVDRGHQQGETWPVPREAQSEGGKPCPQGAPSEEAQGA